MIKYTSFFLFILFTVSCSSSEKFTGYSYDPPGVTNTTDKEIDPQKKRIIGVGDPTVWISNEFEGARVSDFYMAADSMLEVFIEPENAPINNSPWYAFKVWADTGRHAYIRLNYGGEAYHRYIPKVLEQKDGLWEVKKEAEIAEDTAKGTATLSLKLGKEPLIISAQPLNTTSTFISELEEREITTKEFVTRQQVGNSRLGRPIWELSITEAEANEKNTAPVLVIISRQHPPEVSGYKASMLFLEEMTSDTDLAKRFRETFVIKAYPMLNPDGADLGHWRHNTGGIDLNRDWEFFNQPETRAVRDALLPLKEDQSRKVFYGIDFHSTNENIFYPINEEVKTTPDNFTQRWASAVIEANPDIAFNVEEFEPNSPIAKNWIYKTFGADAVTYEMNDEISPVDLRALSQSAARLLMEMLLEDWNKTTLE